MAESTRPLEQMLDLTEEAPSAEHLDNQVQKAQEQLLQLKRQQEQIEKQKRELEELSRRQDELEHGRGEMSDKLTRSLVVLEREASQRAKQAGANPRGPREFRPTFGIDRSDRSEELESIGFAQGTEPRVKHGG